MIADESWASRRPSGPPAAVGLSGLACARAHSRPTTSTAVAAQGALMAAFRGRAQTAGIGGPVIRPQREDGAAQLTAGRQWVAGTAAQGACGVL